MLDAVDVDVALSSGAPELVAAPLPNEKIGVVVVAPAVDVVDIDGALTVLEDEAMTANGDVVDPNVLKIDDVVELSLVVLLSSFSFSFSLSLFSREKNEIGLLAVVSGPVEPVDTKLFVDSADVSIGLLAVPFYHPLI